MCFWRKNRRKIAAKSPQKATILFIAIPKTFLRLFYFQK